jgi:hypothetical protein
VWIDNVRQGQGLDPTFVTLPTQSDGVYSFPLASNGSILSAGLHQVVVLKATEPDWNGGDPVPNYMTFSGFTATAITGDTPPQFVSKAGAPLPVRKLEFLGDSITAGFCNECVAPPALPDNRESWDASWDARIGQKLDAQVHTVAWSGLGMIKNCCGGNTTMPSIYSRTLATVNEDNTWDYTSWTPDALVSH